VNNFGESTGTELSALFGAGLVLLVIGILVNSAARWLVLSTGHESAGVEVGT
jgi:ABC-type phosphate transport system permease subunit